MEEEAEMESAEEERFEARTTASRTKRACKLRFRTFETISLLQAPPEGPAAALPFAFEGDDGACAFRAARICGGATVVFGASLWTRTSEELEGSDDVGRARSMAPLKVSNKTRTSPVKDEIFFVRNISVGVGKNFCTSS